MKRVIENIKQSQYVRNVSTLATGTLIVQIISTLISPVLSRLYTPADYGLFAVFSSCINVLAVICCFRYELAILIPEKNSESKQLLKLCLVILTLFSFLIFIITIFFNNSISGLLGNPAIGFWLYFVSPVVLAAGIVQAFTYMLNRNKSYKTISGVRVLQSSFNSGTSLLLGILKMNSFGLLVGFIVSQAVSALYVLKKSMFEIKNLTTDFDQLKFIARKYIEFPLYNLPSALLDTFSVNVIIFLLNYFFSEAVTGAYAFSLRILSIPSVVIGASIGQVFFQKISEAFNNKEKITGQIFKTWKILFMLIVIPTVIIFFFGEELFTFIFGKSWSEAGNISRYLCLLIFFSFISSPTSSAMLVLGKQKSILALNIVTFIYRPLTLLYGYQTKNFMNGIILYVILEIIQIIIYNLIMLKAAKRSDSALS